MSKLRFDGQGAGLGKVLGGDANNPSDYTLICTCQTELGPLARFFPNPHGERSALCLVCKHVTIVDKEGQIKGVVPAPKEILERLIQ